jgi:hypothetical protein
MTRKRQTKSESPEEVSSEETPKVEAIAEEASPAPAPVVAERRVSFVQWARRRAVKPHHRRGLRAFCGSPDKSRTLKEWDVTFANY